MPAPELPNEDPSNPGLPAPLFADVDAVRGDQMRANNQLIWGNLQYLLDNVINALLTGLGSGADTAISATDSVLDAFEKLQAQVSVARAPGTIVQVAYAQTIASSTGSNPAGAFNDNIPQNTEGNEFLTCSITPKFASSNLLIEAKGFFGEDNNVSVTGLVASLFRDSGANAIAAEASAYTTNGEMGGNIEYAPVYLQVQVAAGSTSATTFKLRAGLFGPGASAALRVNGLAGGRRLGGSMITWIKITEIAA